MAEATLEVRNRLGLHLRASSTLAQTVKSFSSNITVSNGGEEISAKSVTNLIMLGAGQGTKLKLRAEGSDADEALKAIKRLFDDRFGED
ncbi:MAG: HPr family phosphocarrier protein [Candidatus Binataceae bacterium]